MVLHINITDMEICHLKTIIKLKTKMCLDPRFDKTPVQVNWNTNRYKNPENWHTGPGCSKPMTSLLNVSLKFQTLISSVRQYFLLKKK